ncbi:glycosyltransferase [Halorutilales archaeon Cl-col2-1]
MAKDISVCQLITALPYGGAENMVRDLVSASDRIQFSVGFFGDEDALVPEIEEAGVPVRHFGEEFRFDPRAVKRFNSYLREKQIDILHLHLPYAQTLGRLIGSMNDVRIVSTQHNVPSNYHPVTRTTERLTRSLDDKTVAVSQGVERAFTGSAHEPGELDDDWCTVYNGINVEKFAQKVKISDGVNIREQLNIDQETPIFLNVGRYVPVKGQSNLIDAFAQSKTDAHLIIVGHGELEKELRSEVKSHGVQDTVHITGRVPEVHPYYAAADAFVSGSKAEGHPITILEAMAASLPVVAPDIPGVREAVHDSETGILYPLGRVDSLLEAINEIAENEVQNQYGKAGYERAKEYFDVKTMSDSYTQIYRQLSKDSP